MTSPEPISDTLRTRWPDGLYPTTQDLVVEFATALAEKLHKAEQKYGYEDEWRAPDWEEECRKQLWHHISKGDPLDVAAYCAFMWWHKWSSARKQEER